MSEQIAASYDKKRICQFIIDHIEEINTMGKLGYALDGIDSSYGILTFKNYGYPIKYEHNTEHHVLIRFDEISRGLGNA